MRHGSLFSGIGGFDLAAEWMGWENVFHCEWNPFGQKILHHYWPDAEQFNDITKTDFKKYHGTIDVISGGFPCQPYSSAGKRKGKEDERHLWPEMLRAIREIQPRWVVGENVLGLVNWSGGLVFHEVQADLEAEGYEVQPFLLPAAAVGAPHRRDRIWFVAYNNSIIRGKGRKFKSAKQSRYGKGNENSNTEIHGFIAHTNFGTKGPSRKSGSPKTNRSHNNDEPSKWRKPTKFDIGRYEFLRNATNPNGNGQHQCNSNDEINASEGRINALGNAEQGNGNGNATDTNDKRLEGQTTNRNMARKQRPLQRNIQSRGSWQNFPTQSPVCGGDDGLPTQLDGITFPKWRAESIKGYGNAVVPQVVYQIFKSIQQYEQL